MWQTAEHAYQAAKFKWDSPVFVAIHAASSAHGAKKIAHAHKDLMDPEWDKKKLVIMEEIIRAKLEQHPYIQEKLLVKSENKEIVEDSPKDSFWGRGADWEGQNHLGKIWMKLREEFRQQGDQGSA